MAARKAAALRMMKVAAAAADRLRPPPRGVVVLIYHRVGARTAVEVDLPTQLFDEQVAALAESGRVVTLDDAVAALKASEPPESPPLDPVVVTFDDGTADFAEEAVPVLVRYGVPATLYVATDFVERGVPFPDDGVAASWDALRDAVSTGIVTLGSHTHTHALLDRLEPSAVAEELDRSVQLIEDRVGVRACHFAYPKAVAGSADADAAVRARFDSASLGGNRPNTYDATDLHRLARTAIQVSDGMRWFHRKLAGGMALEDTMRRAINRRRYAEAST